MIKKIISGWSFRRALYLGLGILLIVQSVVNNMWFGVIFGAYFAAMGLFSFGCAGGHCATDTLQSKSATPDEDARTVKTIKE